MTTSGVMSRFVAFERADDSWVLIRLCRHLHGRLGQRLSGVSTLRDTDGTILMLLTSHSVINKYSGRNYLFEVSPNMQELFDAGRVGNAMRFLNHDVNANCEARGKSQRAHGCNHQLKDMHPSSSC